MSASMLLAGFGFLLVASTFSLIVLIAAFNESLEMGLLSMFIPLFILYFAFVKYTSPKKGLVLAVWLGATAIGGGLCGAGIAVAQHQASEAAEAADEAAARARADLARMDAEFDTLADRLEREFEAAKGNE